MPYQPSDLLAHPFDEPAGEARKSGESASKARLDLVPTAALEAIAEVLTFGAAKYDDNNWCRGARWGRYYAALLRHLFAWWRGEDLDKETGLSHLAHAGCCLFFLLEYQRNGWGTDDRFRGPDQQPFTKDDGASSKPEPVTGIPVTEERNASPGSHSPPGITKIGPNHYRWTSHAPLGIAQIPVYDPATGKTIFAAKNPVTGGWYKL